MGKSDRVMWLQVSGKIVDFSVVEPNLPRSDILSTIVVADCLKLFS